MDYSIFLYLRAPQKCYFGSLWVTSFDSLEPNPSSLKCQYFGQFEDDDDEFNKVLLKLLLALCLISHAFCQTGR